MVALPVSAKTGLLAFGLFGTLQYIIRNFQLRIINHNLHSYCFSVLYNFFICVMQCILVLSLNYILNYFVYLL